MENDTNQGPDRNELQLAGWGCLPVALVLKCWDDPAFVEKLRRSPAEALADAGVPIQQGIKVILHENSADTVHFIIPVCPAGLRQADPKQLTPDQW